MLKFQKEALNDAFFAEIKPLISAHWEEIAHFKDIPLDPDFALYQKIQDAGNIRVFTVRDHEDHAPDPSCPMDGNVCEVKKLVGYALYFTKVNLHYKSSNQAVQDILFIHPDHRGAGRKFIAWCDEQLRAEGIQAVYQHMKAKHNFGPMLERIGYELQDLVYVRRLN